MALRTACAAEPSNNEGDGGGSTGIHRITRDSENVAVGPIHDCVLINAKEKFTRKEYRESLAELRKVDGNSPEEEAIKLILTGQCFEELHDFPRAFSAYRKAKSVAPGISVSILREAVLCYKLCDLERARFLLDRYVTQESGNPEAYCYLYFCAVLFDEDAEQQANFLRQVIVLDGPRGSWLARAKIGPVASQETSGNHSLKRSSDFRHERMASEIGP